MGVITIVGLVCLFIGVGLGVLCYHVGLIMKDKYCGYYKKYDGEIYALLLDDEMAYGVPLLRLSDNRVFVYDNDYFNGYAEHEGKTVKRFKYVGD